jgi:Tfp pilus assembly protein PilE
MVIPLNTLITITLNKALHPGCDGVNTLHVSKWKTRRKTKKGFLLLELALALVIMSITMAATLHLINSISRVYMQAAQTASLVHVAQLVGEQGTGRRDGRDDACEVVTSQLPQEILSAGDDPFSWVMRHVAVSKVAVHSRRDVQYPAFELMVVKDG